MMDLNRRQFLQGLLGLAGASAIPIEIERAPESIGAESIGVESVGVESVSPELPSAVHFQSPSYDHSLGWITLDGRRFEISAMEIRHNAPAPTSFDSSSFIEADTQFGWEVDVTSFAPSSLQSLFSRYLNSGASLDAVFQATDYPYLFEGEVLMRDLIVSFKDDAAGVRRPLYCCTLMGLGPLTVTHG